MHHSPGCAITSSKGLRHPAAGAGGAGRPGHAVVQGLLAPGCAGCQDVASTSVALGDQLMQLAYARGLAGAAHSRG
jgi:hypothetical protein